MSDTILDARGPYAVQMAGGAGSSLRTQTQLRNAHCEEPALLCTSAFAGVGSCLV